MTKDELVKKIAAASGDSQKSVEQHITRMAECIQDLLVSEEVLIWKGFGTFSVKKRAAHPARNPTTGEIVNAPATRRLAFKPGKDSIRKE